MYVAISWYALEEGERRRKKNKTERIKTLHYFPFPLILPPIHHSAKLPPSPFPLFLSLGPRPYFPPKTQNTKPQWLCIRTAPPPPPNHHTSPHPPTHPPTHLLTKNRLIILPISPHDRPGKSPQSSQSDWRKLGMYVCTLCTVGPGFTRMDRCPWV